MRKRRPVLSGLTKPSFGFDRVCTLLNVCFGVITGFLNCYMESIENSLLFSTFSYSISVRLWSLAWHFLFSYAVPTLIPRQSLQMQRGTWTIEALSQAVVWPYIVKLKVWAFSHRQVYRCIMHVLRLEMIKNPPILCKISVHV